MKTHFFCQKWFWKCTNQIGYFLFLLFFIIIILYIDFEIWINSNYRLQNNKIPNLDFDMLYYIADTILFSINNRIFNELFKFIEIIFIKYGLCLNKNKYVLY